MKPRSNEPEKDNNTTPQPEPAAEENAAEAQDTAAEEQIAALTAQLQEAAARQEEYLSMAQRTQADFDNFRRRNASARAEARTDGINEVLQAILPALDSLDRAMENADPAFADGIERVRRQLMEPLQKFGLTPIEAVGQDFDPALHNAVMQAQAEGVEAGKVVAEFQKGYTVEGKVLRYSSVSVSV